MVDSEIVARALEVIEQDVLPLTTAGVAAGNKLFGAAILRADDLSLVVAGTNTELVNPLWHGEIDAINKFYALPEAERPSPADCYFLATHEPCSLCLSGITWSGFGRFGYLYSHQDSADSFAIPHDIRILRAVYAVPDPDRDAVADGRDLYNRSNEFFVSDDLGTAARAEPTLAGQLARIDARYVELSATYQASKSGNNLPHN